MRKPYALVSENNNESLQDAERAIKRSSKFSPNSYNSLNTFAYLGVAKFLFTSYKTEEGLCLNMYSLKLLQK